VTEELGTCRLPVSKWGQDGEEVAAAAGVPAEQSHPPAAPCVVMDEGELVLARFSHSRIALAALDVPSFRAPL